MVIPPFPENEAERVAALNEYAILDTVPERSWDDVAALAARLCKTSMAMVTFVDSDRQWFKARVGMPIAETPRDWSFCAHAIMEPEKVMVVEDLTKDERFVDNPFVTMKDGMRFYAGAPIVTPTGQPLGTVCVLSNEPGEIGPAEMDGLQALGRQISSALEFRKFTMKEVERVRQHADEIERAHEALRQTTEDLQLVLTNTPGLIAYWDDQQRNCFSNSILALWSKIPEDQIPGAHVRDVIGEEMYQDVLPHIEAALRGESQRFERMVESPNGQGVLHTQTIYKPHWRDGKVCGFFVLVTDITGLKQVQSALYEEKERARVTLGAIGDGVITTDPHGVIDYLNPIAQEMVGLSREEAVGLPIETVMTLLDENSREPLNNPLRKAIKENRTIESSGQACLIGKDGVERGVEENASPIRDVNGGIIGGVVVFRDVTQNRLLSRRLSHQATHDALTGLPNRSQFSRVASDLLESAQREQREHALLCMDLDGFKSVNDSCGHLAGDEVLREVSSTLTTKLRKSDLLARMGGDEFAVLLPDCPLPIAQQIAQNLVAAVSNHCFKWEGKVLPIGVSVGVTALRASTKGLTEAISEADAACYQAKRAGRNRAYLFEPSQTTEAQCQPQA